MSDEMDGTDMAIMKWQSRRPSATLAGRIERESRPLPRADRVQISNIPTKSRQLNLKVTPEFYERVSATARTERLSMPNLMEKALEFYLRHGGGR